MKPSRYRLLHQLAVDARPRDDDDYGSDRQIDAENTFFGLVSKCCTKDVMSGLYGYCLKATADERIAAGVEAAKGFNAFSAYRPHPFANNNKEHKKGKKSKKDKKKNRIRQPWEAARPEP